MLHHRFEACRSRQAFLFEGPSGNRTREGRAAQWAVLEGGRSPTRADLRSEDADPLCSAIECKPADRGGLSCFRSPHGIEPARGEQTIRLFSDEREIRRSETCRPSLSGLHPPFPPSNRSFLRKLDTLKISLRCFREIERIEGTPCRIDLNIIRVRPVHSYPRAR